MNLNPIIPSEQCETVIILGAGASCHAGLPTLPSFRESMRQTRSKALEPEERELLCCADYMFDNYGCRDDNNIENLFSTVSSGVALGSPKAEEDRGRLAKAIAITLAVSRNIPECSSDAYRCLAELIGDTQLLDTSPELVQIRNWQGQLYHARVTVVTFNQDVALDVGFTRAQTGKGWRMLLQSWLAERKRESYCPILTADCEAIGSVLCLRPHGSLGWGVCPVCHRVQVKGSDVHLGSLHLYHEVTKTPCSWHTGEGSPTLEPCIVAPTWDKRTNVPDLQGVRVATAQVLMHCQRLLVIGFSLPPTDANVSSLIRFALSRNKNLRRVMVVDPCDKVHERWQSIVKATQSKPLSVSSVKRPFECALDEIRQWFK